MRWLLALVSAAVLSLGVAVPVFAAPAPGETPRSTDSDPRVIGGEPVPNGKYEFVTALLDKTRAGTTYDKQFCGGTLIDNNSVLTAAHCVEGVTAVQLQVAVGRTELNSDQGQIRNVSAIQRHPRYTTSEVTFRYDAAVLQLSSPVTGIQPVKLPPTTQNAYENPGRSLTVAGWGNIKKQSPDGGEPDSFPMRMREAEVPVVADGTARNVYDASYAAKLMVAAGREGKDTCQGDSGGPLFERTDNGRYQVGITSFGAGCGAKGFPGVYAEVNSGAIRPFIVNAGGL